MNNLANAQIELAHIKLELENGRTQHFRSFVDQYFCYKHGYVNRNGKAKWADLFWKETVSIEAKKTDDRSKVTKEHVIPLKVITFKLEELQGSEITIASIEKILDKYTFFATITKEENKLLNAAKLSQKMPNEFYDSSNDLFNDPFARYKKVGIKYETL